MTATPANQPAHDWSFAELIDMPAAAKLLPGRVSTTTLWRWGAKGKVLIDGNRANLRTVKVGSRPYTTEKWLREFIEKTTTADRDRRDVEIPPRPRTTSHPSDRERRSSHELAVKELEEAGL